MLSPQDVANRQAADVELVVFSLINQAAVTGTPTSDPTVLAEGYKQGAISRSATGVFTIDLKERGARIVQVVGAAPIQTGNRSWEVTTQTTSSITITFKNLAGAGSNANFNLGLLVFRKSPVY